MARAKQRAQVDAQKKAGVYLKTFSRTINSERIDDEVSAVTNNIIELVGDVHYDKKIIPLSEQQTTLLYTTTLKAKIDPDGISDWLNRDAKDKVTIVQQNSTLQNAASENDKLAADLTEQYQRAKTQAEKDKLRKQTEQADRDFLANQKLEEGLKLYYAKDYSRAIRLYNKAIELNPNLAVAYYLRGVCYPELGEEAKAQADLTRAKELGYDG